MITLLIPLETIAWYMPLKVGAHQVAIMEARGISIGAILETTPMKTVKLQLCARSADVGEVIEIKDTTNIGYINMF